MYEIYGLDEEYIEIEFLCIQSVIENSIWRKENGIY